MNRRAMIFLAAGFLIFAATPGEARDSKLLDMVVDSSNIERASAEHNYRVESGLSRKGEKNETREVRSMHVEIGDELGAETVSISEPVPKHLGSDSNYRENGVSKKLDHEWQEVNRGMRESSVNRGSRSASTTSIGSSSNSSRSRSAGRVRDDSF